MLTWRRQSWPWSGPTRNELTCWGMTYFSLKTFLGWLDCLLNYKKNYKSRLTIQDLLIFWHELTLNGEKWVKSQPDNSMKCKICSDLYRKATNSKNAHWDNISKIAQNSACDTFPGSRSYLMKRFNLFFGDVPRDWVLKQGVWLTIFFISKQLLVQSLHDQDHIWWKVSNFSSEMFLEKVDLGKVVNFSDLDIF